jgi:hypothetical protein
MCIFRLQHPHPRTEEQKCQLLSSSLKIKEHKRAPHTPGTPAQSESKREKKCAPNPLPALTNQQDNQRDVEKKRMMYGVPGLM